MPAPTAFGKKKAKLFRLIPTPIGFADDATCWTIAGTGVPTLGGIISVVIPGCKVIGIYGLFGVPPS